MSKLTVLAGLLLAGAVIAPSLADTPAPLSPLQIIAARQAAYDMSAATFVGMIHAVKGGGDAKSQGDAAAALAKWAKVLPTLFPAGTGAGQTSAETKARPEIWSDPAGFQKAAANYAAQTAKLSELSEAGDTPGFTAQLGEVKKACGACHENYRAR
jgi:cytochrome c556